MLAAIAVTLIALISIGAVLWFALSIDSWLTIDEDRADSSSHPG